jgi:hypothetical protein
MAANSARICVYRSTEGLAVALGIGTAVAIGHGVALADTAASDSADAASSRVC